MKVLINRQWGGFGFSEKAIKLICKLKKLEYAKNNRHEMFDVDENPDMRTDKDAIFAVEYLGDDANTRYSKIVVAEIPDGSFFQIREYDGLESLYYSNSEIKKFENKPVTA